MKYLFGASKFYLYKRFLLDIWCYYKNTLKVDKYSRVLFFSVKERRYFRRLRFNRYIYSINIRKYRRQIRKRNLRFNYLKFLMLFYLVFKKRDLINKLIISLKKEGKFVSNYLLALEGTVFNLLIRSRFILNLFNVHYFVCNGIFSINNKVITYLNYTVKFGNILSVNFRYLKKIKAYLKSNFNQVLYSIPGCLFVDFKFFFSLFFKLPNVKDFAYPKFIDIWRSFDLTYF